MKGHAREKYAPMKSVARRVRGASRYMIPDFFAGQFWLES